MLGARKDCAGRAPEGSRNNLWPPAGARSRRFWVAGDLGGVHPDCSEPTLAWAFGPSPGAHAIPPPTRGRDRARRRRLSGKGSRRSDGRQPTHRRHGRALSLHSSDKEIGGHPRHRDTQLSCR